MWPLILLTVWFISAGGLEVSSKNGTLELLDADTLASFQQEVLQRHNEYRAKHGSADLVLDQELSELAQQWAEVLAEHGRLIHSKRYGIGENLHRNTAKNLSGYRPVDNWYNEIQNYTFGEPVRAKGTGHFTQVVWKKSQKLGVGVAKKGRQTYVVANYVPGGNIRGTYGKNVLPPNEN